MWKYLLVFLACFLFDLFPVIGPPAWTAMVFLQLKFDLQIWPVLIIGVIASTLGRYCLSLYIPKLSGRFIKTQKNEDLIFLGEKLGKKGWRAFVFILVYTLTPLPSTPIFTAAGMARLKPIQIIPPFFIGKFTSDAIMVLSGKYAAENVHSIKAGLLTWQSLTGIGFGLLLIFALLFVDWKTLLQKKQFRLEFRIWK